MVSRDIQRRTYLKTAGSIAGVGVLTGCMGGTGGDGEETTGGGGSDGESTEQSTSTATVTGSTDADFPTRNPTIVIPYGPGGGFDFYARTVARNLPAHLPNDVDVVPQNVEGAGGRIATEEVYTAEPDGYTTLLLNVSASTPEQAASEVGYDVREFTYLAQILYGTRAIGVGKDTGIENWEDLVSRIRNNEIRFGTSGRNTAGAVVFAVMAELGDLFPIENVLDNLVVYDGFSEISSGVLSGDVHVMAGGFASIYQFVESDILSVPLVVTTESAPPESTPEADTLQTAGVPNADDIVNITGDIRVFVGPPDLPEDRATTLRDAFDATINSDEVQASAAESDRPIDFAPYDEAEAAAISQFELWKDNPNLLEILGFS